MASASELLLWGHSLAEYQAMFALSATDLAKPILDCASGFASFTAEMHKDGRRATACDPAYKLAFAQLEQEMMTGFRNMVAKIKQRPDEYVWKFYGSPEVFIQQDETNMQKFFADFPEGQKAKRYVAGALPTLPFKDQQFKLALCAYFLFSSAQQSLAFQVAAIKELTRVAGEARIFPLVDQTGQPATQLAPLMLELQQANYGVEVKAVNYELQKGGNAMLRVWSQECEVE